MTDPKAAALAVKHTRQKINPLPPIDDLHEILECKNGILIWRHRPHAPLTFNKRFAGKPAGHRCKDGRITVHISGKLYLAHRVIWAMENGRDPEGSLIDHKNMDRRANGFSNLREATHSQNAHNCHGRRWRKSKFKGVFFSNKHLKFVPQIQVNKRAFWLGRYKKEQEAAAVYRAASAILVGEFSSTYEIGIKDAARLQSEGNRYIIQLISEVAASVGEEAWRRQSQSISVPIKPSS